MRRELGWIPAFSRCGQDELERIDELACGLRLTSGNVLVAAGKPVRQVMVVVDGVVTSEGQEGRLLHHPPGLVLGAHELHEGRLADRTTTAASDVTVLVFGPAEFAALLEIPGARAGVLSPTPERVRTHAPVVVGRPSFAPAT